MGMLSHWTKMGYVDLEVFQNSEDIWNMLVPTTDLAVLGKCSLLLIGWFIFLVILFAILPGETILGAPLPGQKEKRLSYKLNGHSSFWVVVSALAIFKIPLNDYLFRYYEPLACLANFFTTILSVYFYLC